jgi:hypothetical protein
VAVAGNQPEEHTMYELDYMNPDVLQAEVAYRRERLTAARHVGPSRLGRWLRSRRRPAPKQTV